MKTKFTQGPWKFTNSYEYNKAVFSRDTNEGYYEVETNLYREEGLANANLIAAAPLMYAALEQIIQTSFNGSFPDVFKDAEKLKKLLNLCGNIADRTIAKARGEK